MDNPVKKLNPLRSLIHRSTELHQCGKAFVKKVLRDYAGISSGPEGHYRKIMRMPG
jgi:hypothetical protein